MTELRYGFEYFFSRDGFNDAATHFDTVGTLLEDFEDKINLADRLNQLLNEKEIRQEQTPSIVSALLTDKFGYHHSSVNMPSNFEPTKEFVKELSTWKGADFVVVYNHPDLGFTTFNPKNPRHWDMISLLKKNELVTVYTGGFSKALKDPKIAKKGADTFINLILGQKTKTPEDLKKGSFKFVDIEEPEKPKAPAAKKTTAAAKKAAPTAAAAPAAPKQEVTKVEPTSSANRRMTPFYSVPVTNELFHNGNVEAWKKVIQSYQTKHPGLEVYIYYDGERIHDIHSLFKWGKVKHGSTILFAVAGEDIKDVAKLQRYLRQGASPRFEAFLKFPVNKILNLF